MDPTCTVEQPKEIGAAMRGLTSAMTDGKNFTLQWCRRIMNMFKMERWPVFSAGRTSFQGPEPLTWTRPLSVKSLPMVK